LRKNGNIREKNIKGKTYYYYSKWEKVNGKCKRVWQKYLGSLENILKTFENNEPANPQYVEIFQHGFPSVLWNECSRSNIITHVNSLCQKRSQGLSVGSSIAIAAINRAIKPGESKVVCLIGSQKRPSDGIYQRQTKQP
jgi:hypothetical protein